MLGQEREQTDVHFLGINFNGLAGQFGHGIEVSFISDSWGQFGLFAITNDASEGCSGRAWQESHAFFKRLSPLIPFVVLGE